MSKYPIGRYDTGEIQHVHFRRRKHYTTSWRNGKIRERIWIAKMIQKDKSIDKQTAKVLESKKFSQVGKIKTSVSYSDAMMEIDHYLQKGVDSLTTIEEKRLDDLSNAVEKWEEIQYPMPMKTELNTEI